MPLLPFHKCSLLNVRVPAASDAAARTSATRQADADMDGPIIAEEGVAHPFDDVSQRVETGDKIQPGSAKDMGNRMPDNSSNGSATMLSIGA